FTIIATDTTGCQGSRIYTGVRICGAIALSPTTLPGGTIGTAYNQTITGSGGTAPYTFAVTSGALPGGLSLSTAGVISGTATTEGNFNFTITATDSTAVCTGARAYTVRVCPASIAVNPATLPGGTIGTAYSQTLTGSGGTAPYTFGVSAGALPGG